MSDLIKFIKYLSIPAGILALLGVAVSLMFPAVLKSSLPQVIAQATGRAASINRIDIDPFSIRFSVQGFSLSERDNKPFAAFNRFFVDFELWRSIKESALVIASVRLDKPTLRIVKQKDGQFNFSDLLKSDQPAKKEDNKVFPIIVDTFSLPEGKLAWEDAYSGKPVAEEIHPVDFEIKNFSMQDAKSFPVKLSLALKSGAKLDWQGEASLNPISSMGHIKLDGVNLNQIVELAAVNMTAFDLQGKGALDFDYTAGYAEQSIVLAIKHSRIKLQDFQFAEKGQSYKFQDGLLEGDYQFSYADNQWRLNADKSKLDVSAIQLSGLGGSKTSIDVSAMSLAAGYQAGNAENHFNFVFNSDVFELKNANLIELDRNEPLVKIPSISVKGITFDLGKQAAAIETVKSDGVSFKAWLNPDQKINYLSLLPVADAAAIQPEANEQPPVQDDKGGWSIDVKAIDLEKFEFAFEDRTLAKPFSVIDAKPINIKLDNFTNKAGVSVPLQFDAVINETGSIKLTGDTVINPFSTRLSVDIKEIDLEKFQPYIEKIARLDIIDGRWSAAGKLAIALPAKEKPDINFKGDTGIAGLITRDQLLNKDFIKWKNLSLRDIDADVKANRYSAKRLVIDKPYVRVIIAKDKSVNVNDVFMTTQTKTAAPSSTNKTGPQDNNKPSFKLDKIQVIDGSSDFADLSLILPFAAQIKSLDGGASGISSEPKSTVKVDLKGNAYDLAPVDIKGDISPYLGDYQVELNFQGMPMPLVSPYMVQFAGYKVEKGKLTLGLKYKIENRQLTASNNILIDQFELGEKVENPNAVSVPLELAVALLKDADGKIKMDVPITGSLEDPKFSIGKIIGEALLNSITKIVTSPFKAIASLIGSEENLSTVSFAPGKSELDEKQRHKLDELIKFLKERPVLNIEVKGAAFQQDDWPALKAAALYDQLKKQKAAEVVKNGGKKILAEYVELSDDEYKRLLADKFIEKFPLLADKSLFGTPRLIHPEAGDFYVVAKEKLSALIKPEENRLKHLAEERAQAIAKYFVEKGGISNDRIYILDTVVDPERDTQEIVSRLSLKTNG